MVSVKRRGKESEITVKLAGKTVLNNGDGLTYLKESDSALRNSINISERVPSVDGFRINSVTEQNPKSAVINVFGRVNLTSGTVLYRNLDAEFEKTLDSKNFAQRSVSYDLECSVEHKEGNLYTLVLKAKDESMNTACESLDFEYSSELGVISPEKLKATLSKRLDEYSSLNNLTITGETDRLSLRLSSVNELRRKVLTACLEHDRVNADSLFIPFKFESDTLRYPKNNIDSRLVLNTVSKRFYEACGSKVGLDDTPKESLEKNSVMTCKFCLINEYGTCSKLGGKVSGYTLSVSGKTFKIRVDCKKCFMHILSE